MRKAIREACCSDTLVTHNALFSAVQYKPTRVFLWLGLLCIEAHLAAARKPTIIAMTKPLSVSLARDRRETRGFPPPFHASKTLCEPVLCHKCLKIPVRSHHRRRKFRRVRMAWGKFNTLLNHSALPFRTFSIGTMKFFCSLNWSGS